MKALGSALVLALLAAAPVAVVAQSAVQAKPAAAKPAAKPAPKLAPSAQKAVEEVTPIDDDPDIKLSPADLEIAKQVHVGEIPCELGATVHVRPARRDGPLHQTLQNKVNEVNPPGIGRSGWPAGRGGVTSGATLPQTQSRYDPQDRSGRLVDTEKLGRNARSR